MHLTMDASNLAPQTLESSAAKALRGLSLAREYLTYGFTTLRDLGSMDPEFPTIDLRKALNAGLVQGPRLIVAGHIISASAAMATCAASTPRAGTCRCPRSPTVPQEIRRPVRREHAYGADWIKTANAGGYFSVGDDPARATWFDEEMEVVCSTARFWGCRSPCTPVPAEACKQAACCARSLKHAYLIDEEASTWPPAPGRTLCRPCR